MLTTFSGQRFDPQLKLNSLSTDAIIVSVADANTRCSDTSNGSTINEPATNIVNSDSIEGETYSSTWFCDTPDPRWRDDLSVSESAGDSNIAGTIAYTEDTDPEPNNSGDPRLILFPLFGPPGGRGPTVVTNLQYCVRTVSATQFEAHILDLPTASEDSDEASDEAGSRDQRSFSPSTGEGVHAYHSPSMEPGIPDSNSQFPSPDGDYENDRHPDNASTISKFAPSSISVHLPYCRSDSDYEASVTSTSTDETSSRSSEALSRTASSPVSPIVFRSHNSDPGYTMTSNSAIDRNEIEIALVPRRQYLRHDAMLRATPGQTTTIVPPAQQPTTEKSVWWRIFPSRMLMQRHHQDWEAKECHDHNVPTTLTSEKRTLNLQTPPMYAQTDKPPPAVPLCTPADDEPNQSKSRNGLLSTIFPCLSVVSEEEGLGDSEKCFAISAGSTCDNIKTWGIVRWLKGQGWGRGGWWGHAESGDVRKPRMLEVKVEREVGYVVDQ